uniref:Uncharacterized protein n=1 Tax=Aegilops tauschii TaxID=37682 RepID=N1QR27_AEGTA
MALSTSSTRRASTPCRSSTASARSGSSLCIRVSVILHSKELDQGSKQRCCIRSSFTTILLEQGEWRIVVAQSGVGARDHAFFRTTIGHILCYTPETVCIDLNCFDRIEAKAFSSTLRYSICAPSQNLLCTAKSMRLFS